MFFFSYSQLKVAPGVGAYILSAANVSFYYVISELLYFVSSFPDSPGDNLIVEVWDSKGILHGRVLAQLATIIENPVGHYFFFILEN